MSGYGLAFMTSVTTLVGLAGAMAIPTSDKPADAPHYYLHTGYVFSVRMLGSNDPRVGYTLGLGVGKPEPRLTWGRMPADLIWEVNLTPTSSLASPDAPSDRLSSFGVLGIARYRPLADRRFFLDLGWGLQVSNRPSTDTPSRINSTPTLGIGYETTFFNEKGYFLARWHHASNGGTVGNNPGWNQIWLIVGTKW